MMYVGITGASGFIGSHLVRACLERGWSPVALVRRVDPSHAERGIPTRPYRIGAEPPDLRGLDAVVHCAYDPTADNVAAARDLVSAARSAAVSRIVFVSSLSADDASATRYGREKAACERSFDGSESIVVRPGLVIGPGGLFARMQAAVHRLGIAPVVDGGRQPVYTIGVRDLAECVLDLLAADARGTFVLAAPEPIAMADLYRSIARACGARVVVAPVPYALLLGAAMLAERLRLPFDLSVERVRSLRSLRPLQIPVYPELAHPIAPFARVLAAGASGC